MRTIRSNDYTERKIEKLQEENKLLLIKNEALARENKNLAETIKKLNVIVEEYKSKHTLLQEAIQFAKRAGKRYTELYNSLLSAKKQYSIVFEREINRLNHTNT